ncbi:MAG: hypothetical protein DBX47_06040 [Clostridiales bacterium]|nr:MAG: hypothetical protein DBX47_06040 [Clostridiales bacterium]
MKNYSKILADNISFLRKANNLTQESLAEKVNLSFQAISKWENGQSSPDITLLPVLADIFGVHIDDLFGKVIIKEPHFDLTQDLPWCDDETIRGVVYKGHKILEKCDDISKFIFKYNGEALNVVSYCNIECGEIKNGANAACDINCNIINGGATAGCDINSGGGINGGANAGCNINCNSEINGGVSAGCDVNCGNVTGDVDAGAGVNCGNVGYSIDAGQNVSCGNVGGSVEAGQQVYCGNVEGSVECTQINCGNINGSVECSGNITCEKIYGEVECNGDIFYKN